MPQSDAAGGVTVLICEMCGKQYTYEETPPDNLVCEKCGGRVFRSFRDGDPSEIQQDFRDETERETATNDPPTDVTPGDIADLDGL